MSAVTSPPRAQAAARVRLENPIDLLTAANVFPRGERWKSISVGSLLRWIVAGKAGVRLEAVRIRGKWHTSIPAMGRFCEAVKAREASSVPARK